MDILKRLLAALFSASSALAAAPSEGLPAPDFTLLSQESRPVSLGDYRGHWVVLYFYPKDFTSGCTLEAHNFERDAAKYARLDAVIIGVSRDRVSNHKDFCVKEGLNFKVLADSAAEVSKAYDSLKDFLGAKITARNTFIIDPGGRIARVFLGVKPAGHSEEVLKALEELQAKAGAPSIPEHEPPVAPQKPASP